MGSMKVAHSSLPHDKDLPILCLQSPTSNCCSIRLCSRMSRSHPLFPHRPPATYTLYLSAVGSSAIRESGGFSQARSCRFVFHFEVLEAGKIASQASSAPRLLATALTISISGFVSSRRQIMHRISGESCTTRLRIRILSGVLRLGRRCPRSALHNKG
jgi:hypothetical protein